MNEDPENDRELIAFLQGYAPQASAADSRLESQVMAAIRRERRRQVISPLSLTLMALSAASLLGFVMMKTKSCDNTASLEQYMEESWSGINARHEDLGFQGMLSEMDVALNKGR